MAKTLTVKVKWAGQSKGRLLGVLDNERLIEFDEEPKAGGVEGTTPLPRPDDARRISVLVQCVDDLSGISGTVKITGSAAIPLIGPKTKKGVWMGHARVIP
jgi:hypothetical protein